jgi:AraC-like DNA-binding protein
MLTLPISLVFSLILLFMLAMLRARGPVASGLVLLVLANAAQGGIAAGAQYYGLAAFRAVQPVSAMLIPPAGWLALATAGFDRPLRLSDAMHLIGPALAVALSLLARDALDALIPIAYVGYSVAMLLALRQSGASLPRAILSAGTRPLTLWVAVALGLMLSALSDLAIVAAQIAGRMDLQPLVISVTGSLILLGLGTLGISMQANTGGSATDPSPSEAPSPTEDDATLFARLEDHMRTRQPWREPELTLGQLARRLHVPAKQLSVAVNRCTKDNISRYVNTYRVEAACAALRKGTSVTEAMFEAGFATKSNFNREFARVTGATPSDWGADQASGPI